MRTVGVLLLVLAVVAVGCHSPIKNNLPPSEMLMHPGPGVDGPGPGVMVYQPACPIVPATSQVYFVGPEGMTVSWDLTAPGRFDSEPLVCPGRYNFPQGAIYRLRLANIPGQPGIELYPTLEVGPSLPRTEAYLAHNAIPIQFTQEDFDQVLSGNFVTKVIYLPDPEFQEMALAGVDTLVSTRLDPGVDPIVEADRRGAILGIIRLGNKDFNIPSAGMMGPGGEINQMSYQVGADGQPCPCPTACPMGVPCGAGVAGMPPQFVAGVTAPQYGMPMVGTPIGLPGPPHVPLGIPAGLQRHTMVNHTCVNLPEPTKQVRIDVKQSPGISYPAPANQVFISEKTSPTCGVFHQPCGDKRELINGGCGGGVCPTGGCPTGGYPVGDPGAGAGEAAGPSCATPGN
jgi:hypothetical protein